MKTRAIPLFSLVCLLLFMAASALEYAVKGDKLGVVCALTWTVTLLFFVVVTPPRPRA